MPDEEAAPRRVVRAARASDFDAPKYLNLRSRRTCFASVSPGAASSEASCSSYGAAAYACGPPLTPYAEGGAAMEHRTLVEAMVHTASACDRGITFVSSGGTEAVYESYGALLDAARRVLAGLRSRGLRQSDVVALQLTDPRTHLTAVWACALGGFPSVTVAVAPRLVASNAVAAKLLAALAQLDCRHVYSDDALHAPLSLLLPRGVELHTSSAVDAAAKAAALEDSRLLEWAEIAPDDVMLYQLTSGSTGVPKAIGETHAAIIAHIRQAAQACGHREEDVTLNWLPFDHVVPMIT